MYVRKYVSLRVILKYSWIGVLFFSILSCTVCILYFQLGIKEVAIPFLPISTLGTAVAILLGFRNNSAYDRFWEARKIWGGVVNYSRTFARQITTLFTLNNTQGLISPGELKALHKEMIYRHLAWINALRLHLRQQDLINPVCWVELKEFIEDQEEFIKINSSVNKPTQIIQKQGERLKYAFNQGMIDDFRHMQIDNTLTEFYNLQGKCERIKNTPLPRQYAFFTKLFTWIFIFLLPFGFVQELGWMTIPLTILISWIFDTLERVGHYTEDPFDNVMNDVPMTALCRTIEIDLREQLGENDLPAKIQPVNGVLM